MDTDAIQQRLDPGDYRRLFEALGFEVGDRAPNDDGWIWKVRGPAELGEGRNPNFAVNIRHGGVKDFGSTGYSNDLWGVVQDVRLCSFAEAKQWVIEELGIEDEKAKRQKEARNRFYRWPWKYGRVTDTYTYVDEVGEPLFEVLRYHPKPEYPLPDTEKTFRQRHYAPDDEHARSDGYVYSLSGIRRVLYNLPRVLAAIEGGEAILVTEGEKDSDQLNAAIDKTYSDDPKPAATTAPMGAGKWQESYTETLEAADVRLLPDNDPQGVQHMEEVAAQLHGRAASVKVVELRGLPPKGDVYDWFERGGTLDELFEQIDSTPPYEAQEEDVAPNASHDDRAQEYFVRRGRIYYENAKGPKPVADFAARIDAEITLEDDSRIYDIVGRTAQGRPFRFDISGKEFESSRDLKAAIGEAAGAQSPIRAGMTRHIAPALKTLSNQVDERRRYKRTGWSDHGFLIPGRSFEGVEIDVTDTLAYGLAPNADLDKGQQALAHLLDAMDPHRTIPLFIFALTGPAATLMPRIKRYGFFIKGRTGSLKTSYAQALLSIWGPRFLDDKMLLKFGEGMTRNAAMAVATAATDMPILFDNYKPNTGGGHEWLVNLIHNIVEGGEKLRLSASAELKGRSDVHCWPVSTGEDVPDTDPATLARQLIVEFSWRAGRENRKLARAQDAGQHLSAIGRTWLEWLETPDVQAKVTSVCEEYSTRRAAWNAFLLKERPDMVNPARVADNLTTNSIVGEIATHCPPIAEVLGPRYDDYVEGLKQIARDMGDYTSESLEAWRFIDNLRALYAGGRISMTKRLGSTEIGDERTHVGWFDEDGYYLIPELAIAAVEELAGRAVLSGISKRTLYEQLGDLGFVARTGPAATTRKVRVGMNSKIRRVLHLTRAALDGAADTNDDEQLF